MPSVVQSNFRVRQNLGRVRRIIDGVADGLWLVVPVVVALLLLLLVVLQQKC